MLRIDHVMQLHRLFWVPRGMEATEGVYVRYPDEELTAVLTLESHRAGARILGENLGTVPAYVNRALERHGILRTFVLPFEIDPSFAGGRLHRAPDPDEVASVGTHDMPTFHAFWRGDDLADRVDLGLLTAEQGRDEAARRELVRETWRQGLWRSGHLAPGEGDPHAVLAAALASLGESAAPLVLANLEDLWGETAPQNVPGTTGERPNWRRRAGLTLEQMAAEPRVVAALRRLDGARRAAAGAMLATEGSQGHPTSAERGSGEPGHEETDERRAMSDGEKTTITADVADVETVAATESLLTDDDLFLFNEGRHFRLYEKLGAHRRRLRGQEGYAFAVWAPDAERVSVVGDFNGWDRAAHPLAARGSSGIWEGFIPGAEPGLNYKFHIASRFGGYRVDKADPFAVRSEVPPKTGSVLWHLDYEWGDDAWMERRREKAALDAPVSIYELHLGSWRRVPEEGDRPLSYRETAEPLAAHCKELGFTHVELLPIMEHPFYGSWGYQTTGYFAPTSRYGTPQDLMYLIDYLHREGIGVILDWVPSHFPTDEHGLAYFDGTHLFEHSDPRVGYHPDWNSYIFNYGRHEVRAFLISSALYWLERFHVDGLRVDAVASMLYRDYSRQAGEWIPNVHGGRESLEAIDFLRQLNAAVYEHHPDVQTWAEESTAWPMVSRPTYVGGLGFGYKWDMGWMHDTLLYMAKEPVYRRFHQGQLTFRMIYAFSENFTLPLSHDEVVHGKGSLLGKMPGDDWQKLANLRLLYGYMWLQPAKKLLFMGGELAQWHEWSHEASLDWHLLDHDRHRGVSRLIGDLNRLYRAEPALHQLDCDPAGFEWIDTSDAESSVLSFLRRGRDGEGLLVAAFNFTPVPRHSYRLGVPRGGRWAEVLNTDAPEYGGSGQGNLGGLDATPTPLHGRSHSLTMTIPPLGMVVFRSPS
jgi:1,4-alpha-glucan branching enzyme